MAINPLAIGGGVVAAAAVVGGGLYAGGVFSSQTPQPQGGTDNREPKWHYLSQDSDYTNKIDQSNGEYHGKYGQTYNLFLVGVTTSTVKGAEANNTKWWTWSYKNNYKDATKDKGFATGITSGETLKAACLQAYKGTLNNSDKAIDVGTGGNVKKYPEAEVWKFCTPFGEKVKTLSDIGNGETYADVQTFGGATENKPNLVATQAPTNKANLHFWKIREDKLKTAGDNDLTSGDTNEFKKLKNKLNNVPNSSPAKDSLLETCRDAYGKKSTDSATYPKEDIGKFCSIPGTALTKPE